MVLVLAFFLIAVAGGVFLVKQPLTFVNQAYTINTCQQDGGVAYDGSSCPVNTVQIGTVTVDDSTQTSTTTQGGDTQTTRTDTTTTTTITTTKLCCRPVIPTETKVPNTPIIIETPPDVTTPIPETPVPATLTSTPPPQACSIPQPTLTVECQDGCIQQ